MTLEPKQRAFVEHYLVCWNSAEAARRAGYSEKTARSIGSENLTKPNIKAYIDERIAELKMSTDEVLIRLAEQARGSLAEFTDVQLMADLKDHPKAHLIKHLTTDVYEDKAGKLHYKTKFELYDAQAALVHIGKAHGLFADKIDHSGKVDVVGMSLEEWRKEKERRQAEVAETLELFDDDEVTLNEAA